MEPNTFTFNKQTGGNVDALAQKIRELAPNGVTGYYDNTRGWISEAVWKTLIKGARVYVGGKYLLTTIVFLFLTGHYRRGKSVWRGRIRWHI